MEVIEISGYVGEEKLEISKRCLIPDEQKRIGLEPGQVTVTDEALQALIKRYCPEPGVRTLKKHIQRIFARACLKVPLPIILRVLPPFTDLNIEKSFVLSHETHAWRVATRVRITKPNHH